MHLVSHFLLRLTHLHRMRWTTSISVSIACAAACAVPFACSSSNVECDGGCVDASSDAPSSDAKSDVSDGGTSDASDATVCGLPSSLDPTFAEGGLEQLSFPPYPEADTLALQSDGKILVAGRVDNQTIAVARFLANGSADTTFGTAGIAALPAMAGAYYATGLAVQTDGKIIVTAVATNTWNVARIDAQGALDTSFGTSGLIAPPFAKARSGSVAMATDGSVFIAGDVNLGAPQYDFILAKYDSNGQPAAGFGTNGVVTTSFGSIVDIPRVVVVQPDGKPIVGGNTYVSNDAAIQDDLAFARYDPTSGALDTTFGTGGKVTTSFGAGYLSVSAIVVAANGSLLVAASVNYTPNDDFLVLRYTSAGVLDTTFGTSGVARTDFFDAGDYPSGLSQLANGDLVTSGVAYEKTDAGNVLRMAIAAFTSGGTLDVQFGNAGHVVTPVSGQIWNEFYAQALQPDGKLVVAGYGRRPVDGGDQDLLDLARYACP